MTLAVDLAAISLQRWRQPAATLVDAVDFVLADGATLGIVGESGSGKTLVALAIMGLLPRGVGAAGRIDFNGADLLALSEPQWQTVRGAKIGMIFQEPMMALNPAMRIGDQIAEGLLRHKPVSRATARSETLRLLDRVRIPDAARRVDAYPHELSGGQRQRVGIAIALAPGPSLLIADEPTTALDVTVQAEILALLGDLITEKCLSLLLISHDLGVIASLCERTLVMKAGRCVEQGDSGRVLHHPSHAFTRSLIAALPRPSTSATRKTVAPSPGTALLEVRHVERRYAGQPGKAVEDVSFTIERGTIFGLVGESGCGKSTLARMVMGLDRPSGGQVLFEGEDIATTPRSTLMRLRRGFQMVFQDPYGSLDPRQTIGRIVAEPLVLDRQAPRGDARDALVGEALGSVGLHRSDASRYPHAFSGGQRQRIALARAIIGRPKLVVADEPVSALDLTVQEQILRLILDLRDRHGIAFLLISHSLAVVEMVADRVAVMVAGRFVETGPTDAVFLRPVHASTRALIGADLRLDRLRADNADRGTAAEDDEPER